MFYEKIKKHNVNVWIVNTGWTNGKYGVGKRISFGKSQRILDAINDGKLDNVETYKFKYFNFDVPTSIDTIPDDLMYPDKGWSSKIEYE